VGHRERKKERTARAIEDAALSLFAKRGFAATTVAEISEAADISPRTFFGYFPSKESVLFCDFDATFQRLAARLDERTAGESALDALRAWILEEIERDGLPDKRERRRRRVIEANESLLAHERHLMTRFEGLIAKAAARDFDAAPDDLHPRLVAVAAAATLTALRPDLDEPDPAPGADPLQSLDDALAFLRGGVSALRRRRTAKGRAAG
jgi:AcrR family transcriptional regulator